MPEREARKAHDQDPQEHAAQRVVGEIVQRAARIDLGTRTAEDEVQRQDGQREVEETTSGESPERADLRAFPDAAIGRCRSMPRAEGDSHSVRGALLREQQDQHDDQDERSDSDTDVHLQPSFGVRPSSGLTAYPAHEPANPPGLRQGGPSFMLSQQLSGSRAKAGQCDVY